MLWWLLRIQDAIEVSNCSRGNRMWWSIATRAIQQFAEQKNEVVNMAGDSVNGCVIFDSRPRKLITGNLLMFWTPKTNIYIYICVCVDLCKPHPLIHFSTGQTIKPYKISWFIERVCCYSSYAINYLPYSLCVKYTMRPFTRL